MDKANWIKQIEHDAEVMELTEMDIMKIWESGVANVIWGGSDEYKAARLSTPRHSQAGKSRPFCPCQCTLNAEKPGPVRPVK